MGRPKGCNNLPKTPVDERFWSKVNVLGKDECWEYVGRTNVDGYGQFDHHNTSDVAHRFSWMLTNGQIPDGMYVCHTCDNPSCVNPTHLFLGTQKDNMQDMVSKGRGYDRRGKNNPKSKLTEKDVIKIRSLRSDKVPYKEIAKIVGVSEGCINHILNGRHWAWVK